MPRDKSLAPRPIPVTAVPATNMRYREPGFEYHAGPCIIPVLCAEGLTAFTPPHLPSPFECKLNGGRRTLARLYPTDS